MIRDTASELLAGDQHLVGSPDWSDPSIEECMMEHSCNPELNRRLNAVTDAADAVASALLTSAHRTLIDAAFVANFPELLRLQARDAKEDMRRITDIIEEAADTAFPPRDLIPHFYHHAFVDAVVKRLRAGGI
jgi:hypothetical protein